MDNVSLRHNREIVALVESPKFTARFDRELFERDMVGSPDGLRTVQLPAKLPKDFLAALKNRALLSLWPQTLR